MSRTKIEWATDSWNPIVGCTKVSEGCTNCYAKAMNKRFKWVKDWNTPEFFPHKMKQITPKQKPKRIFVCSTSDLFHEDVDTDWQFQIFDKMITCPQHTFILLTKRPQLAYDFYELTNTKQKNGEPIQNIWLGITCENQKAADERIPILLDIPAKVHFISCEPLLDEIDLHKQANWFWAGSGINWIICGGETGPNAREMNPTWARKIRDDCKETGVPFFFKQMSKKETIPEDLLIQEYPNSQ